MGDAVNKALLPAPFTPAPVPTPVPHPGLPLAIGEGKPTVMIGNKPAATATCKSAPCVLLAVQADLL